MSVWCKGGDDDQRYDQAGRKDGPTEKKGKKQSEAMTSKATIRCPVLNLSIQLNKLLQEHDRTPNGGAWAASAEAGLNRRVVTALVRGTAQEIRMHTLEGIASYLVNECHLPLREALASLFAIQPSAFWNMFGGSNDDSFKVRVWEGVANDRNHFRAEVGQRLRCLPVGDLQPPPAGRRGPAAAGSETALLRSYSGEERQKEVWPRPAVRTRSSATTDPPGLGVHRQHEVDALERVRHAHTFRVKPFKPDPGDRAPRLRAVPVFFRYRADDPHPPSVFGGMELPLPAAGEQAGVAFEMEGGKWDICPVSDKEDVGLVFYVYRPSANTMQLCWRGFPAGLPAAWRWNLPI